MVVEITEMTVSVMYLRRNQRRLWEIWNDPLLRGFAVHGYWGWHVGKWGLALCPGTEFNVYHRAVCHESAQAVSELARHPLGHLGG